MKILIIEDGLCYANEMAKALEDLGHVVVCTVPSLREVNFDYSKILMPPKDRVLGLIGEADIILLDNDLGSHEYDGKDLILYCEGKKVIGISNGVCFGNATFNGKEYLSYARPDIAETLRSLVIKVVTNGEVTGA